MLSPYRSLKVIQASIEHEHQIMKLSKFGEIC